MADRSNHVTKAMVLYVYALIVVVCLIENSLFVNGLKTCNAYSKPNSKGVCGKHIDEALRLLCGPGNFRDRSKRSIATDKNVQDMDVADFLALSKQNAQMDDPSERLDFDDILLQKSVATNFLAKRIPFQQSGVACECCYHRCTVHEMAGYCKDRSKALIR